MPKRADKCTRWPPVLAVRSWCDEALAFRQTRATGRSDTEDQRKRHSSGRGVGARRARCGGAVARARGGRAAAGAAAGSWTGSGAAALGGGGALSLTHSPLVDLDRPMPDSRKGRISRTVTFLRPSSSCCRSSFFASTSAAFGLRFRLQIQGRTRRCFRLPALRRRTALARAARLVRPS
jgi:hypothetical protein